MTDIHRRDFLKLMGLTGAGLATGCAQETGEIVPYLRPPAGIRPEIPVYFATTCRECPAGCGVLAKNRDGRIIKLEGNPVHPISRGTLCPRGQAALNGLYHPDRYRGPMVRDGKGKLRSMTWAAAETELLDRLDRTAGPDGGKILFLTDLITGPLADLIGRWLDRQGGGTHLRYEPLAYEALREANRIVFGRDALPTYEIDRADFLLSFGAGFLETWLSNVEYAHRFRRFRRLDGGGDRPLYVHVGPRRSMTGANADLEVRVKPGMEGRAALGVLLAARKAGAPSLPEEWAGLVEQGLGTADLSAVARQAGMNLEALERIGRRFAGARRPLVLAEGLWSPGAVETAVAANLLCSMRPESRRLIRFDLAHRLGTAARAREMRSVVEQMAAGEVKAVFLYNANPAYALPAAWNFADAIAKVPLVVGLSPFPDETDRFAHLILPAHTPLESWGEYSPKAGLTGLMQPTMGPLFNTRAPGDILLSLARKRWGEADFPWTDFHALLKERWNGPEGGNTAASDRDGGGNGRFRAAIRKGFTLADGAEPAAGRAGLSGPPGDFSFPAHTETGADRFHLTVFPTIQFHDGRTARYPWIQEMPDPIAQVTWGGWLEIDPEDAKTLGVKKGDLVRAASPAGSMDIPVLPIPSVGHGTAAVPFGQGHTRFGRYASGLPANPMALFGGEVAEPSGGLTLPAAGVTLTRLDGSFPVANTDGSFYHHDRHMVASVDMEQYREEKLKGKKPEITKPLPEGYEKERDFYHPHVHKIYRWCMVVDLDRCIGCGACVMACYAENNVAFVGREQMLKAREMSWIRVQRYFGHDDHRAEFLVMLCQHCDAAPCEPVCPIFAPQHSPEGLNNQVYNRCFGTRFCSQNDPYKVRRFNWFTFTRPWPMDLQLNPDVTVRQKGIMEKCSFCIQRIVDAKARARNKGRTVRDGDFTTACAQTCPADALVFGNLKDPESRVAELIDDPRAYQVLHHLNTKPAVIYLKRITRTV